MDGASNAGVHFDFTQQINSKLDSSFTRAARSPFGPPSAFGRYAPRRWNDDIEVRSD
jgi:hypothetical protein